MSIYRTCFFKAAWSLRCQPVAETSIVTHRMDGHVAPLCWAQQMQRQCVRLFVVMARSKDLRRWSYCNCIILAWRSRWLHIKSRTSLKIQVKLIQLVFLYRKEFVPLESIVGQIFLSTVLGSCGDCFKFDFWAQALDANVINWFIAFEPVLRVVAFIATGPVTTPPWQAVQWSIQKLRLPLFRITQCQRCEVLILKWLRFHPRRSARQLPQQVLRETSWFSAPMVDSNTLTWMKRMDRDGVQAWPSLAL